MPEEKRADIAPWLFALNALPWQDGNISSCHATILLIRVGRKVSVEQYLCSETRHP
jgi:hypothetical protein